MEFVTVGKVETKATDPSIVTTLTRTFTVKTIEEAKAISNNLIHIAGQIENLFGVDCEVSAPIEAMIDETTISCRLDITK